MDATYVGIDVSKDRLDVHVYPAGTAFAVTRDGKGLEHGISGIHTGDCAIKIAKDLRHIQGFQHRPSRLFLNVRVQHRLPHFP